MRQVYSHHFETELKRNEGLTRNAATLTTASSLSENVLNIQREGEKQAVA